MVACEMRKCPYNYKDTCRDRLTGIDENGMCSQLWRKGQQRPDGLDPVDEKFMKEIELVEIMPKPQNNQEEEAYHQITIEEYMAEKK